MILESSTQPLDCSAFVSTCRSAVAMVRLMGMLVRPKERALVYLTTANVLLLPMRALPR